MRFMNDYDLYIARQRFGKGLAPNRLALVIAVERLAEWADSHSDGWAYWPKPCRAAANAIELIDGLNRADERVDITEAEMLTAVRPIKAFCTRQQREGIMSADERELILRSTQPLFEVI